MAHAFSGTNVRFIVGSWLLGAVGWLAPRWTAGRLVDYAGTTRARRPSLPPPSARAAVLVAGGRPFTTYTWGEGPAVYVQHGWDGSAADFAALTAALVARGVSVVAIDAPGHGSAPGSRSNLVLLAQALQEAIAAGGPARAVVGHSLGASAVGVAAADGATVGRVVLVAPYTDVGGWFAALGSLGGARLRDEVFGAVRRVAGRDVRELGLTHTADALPGPVLVLHDRDDRQAPYADAAALVAAHPRLRLRSTRGLGHRRILSDPAIVEEVVAFVADGRERSCGHGSVRALCEACALEEALHAPPDARW